jgi:hypothetical protein
MTEHLGLQFADLLGQLRRLRQHECRMGGGVRRQVLAQAFRLDTGPGAEVTHRQVR